MSQDPERLEERKLLENNNDEGATSISEFDENPIPFSTSQKAIIPYNKESNSYNLNERDLHDKSREAIDEILQTLNTLNTMQEIFPSQRKISCCVFFWWWLLLIVLMLIVIVIIFYLMLGFLFNPVVVIMLIWLAFWIFQKLRIFQDAYYQDWRMKEFNKYLKRENQRYYKAKKMELSSGDFGKWIELYFDEERGSKSIRMEYEEEKDSHVFDITNDQKKYQ